MANIGQTECSLEQRTSIGFADVLPPESIRTETGSCLTHDRSSVVLTSAAFYLKPAEFEMRSAVELDLREGNE